LSDISSPYPKFAFGIPGNPSLEPIQTVYYLFNHTKPNSSSADANLGNYYDAGKLVFNLSRQSGSLDPLLTVGKNPFKVYRAYTIVHGVFSSLGFTLLVNLGALLGGSVLDTGKNRWWTSGHIFFLVFLAPPFLAIGLTFGSLATRINHEDHFTYGSDGSAHRVMGVVAIVLYCYLLISGAVKYALDPHRRLAHKLLGRSLVFIGIAQMVIGFAQWEIVVSAVGNKIYYPCIIYWMIVGTMAGYGVQVSCG